MIRIGNQIKAARVLADIKLARLSERSGLSEKMIVEFESFGAEPIEANDQLLYVLEITFLMMGVEFIQNDGVRRRVVLGPGGQDGTLM